MTKRNRLRPRIAESLENRRSRRCLSQFFPTLLAVVGNLDNAVDTRYAAAEALGRIADPDSLPAIRQLAAGYPEVSVRRALLEACDLASSAANKALV